MGLVNENWHVYMGDTWIGTLIPTGEDDGWVSADFQPAENWENFAPWFAEAYNAHQNGDNHEWERVYGQLQTMGLAISSEGGEVYQSPMILVSDGGAWFAV